MSARLAAGIEVSALIRRVNSLGGNAAVLARGDAEAGAILLLLAERGIPFGLFERALDQRGDYGWRRAGSGNIDDLQGFNQYIARRRAIDGDLWVVELDIPGVERFAAEMIATG
ncbi:MAG TPA: DUF1491 family protein [Sphingomonas sp.]